MIDGDFAESLCWYSEGIVEFARHVLKGNQPRARILMVVIYTPVLRAVLPRSRTKILIFRGALYFIGIVSYWHLAIPVTRNTALFVIF